MNGGRVKSPLDKNEPFRRVRIWALGGACLLLAILIALTLLSETAVPGPNHPGPSLPVSDAQTPAPQPEAKAPAAEPVHTALVAPAPAAIAGRVYWQDNERGVGGVMVSLYPWHYEPSIAFRERDKIVAETATDEGGHYAFDGIPPGDYIVQRGDARGGALVRKGDWVHVSLEAGERLSGVDCTVERGYAASGRVIDAAGRPIANARVANGYEPAHRTLTDAWGNFRLEGLRAGHSVALEALARGYAVHQFGNFGLMTREGKGNLSLTLKEPGRVLSGTIRDPSGAPLPGLTVRVKEERLAAKTNIHGRFEILGVPVSRETFALSVSNVYDAVKILSGAGPYDFRGQMRLDNAMLCVQVASFAPAAEIDTATPTSGQVFDERGRPLAGAVVGGRTPGNVYTLAWSDQEGKYALSLGSSGSCEIVALAPGYRVAKIESVACGSVGHRIELTPSARLRGQVIAANTGQPVRRFRVCVTEPSEFRAAARDSIERCTLTVVDDAGYFEWREDTPGPVAVYLRAEGYASTMIVLDASPETHLLPLQQEWLMRGLVVDELDRPVADARVRVLSGWPTLFAVADFDQKLRKDLLEAEAITNLDGHVTIHGLDAAVYQIEVFSDSHAPERQILNLAQAPSGFVHFRVTTYCAIEGIVMQHGEPVADATVLLDPHDDGKFAMDAFSALATDEAGAFFFDKLAPGGYTVNCRFNSDQEDSEYNFPSQEITLQPGEVYSLTFGE